MAVAVAGTRRPAAGKVWSGFCSLPLAAGNTMDSFPIDLSAHHVSITTWRNQRHLFLASGLSNSTGRTR